MPAAKKPAQKPPATTRKPAARKPADDAVAAVTPPHAHIAERAYYLSEGDPGGDPVAHWLQAEGELSAAVKKPRKRATA